MARYCVNFFAFLNKFQEILNGKIAGRLGYMSWRKYTNSFKVICYMTNWAQYRPNATKFGPSDVNPYLCTHVIYAFAAINSSTHEIKAFEWNDESKKDLVGKVNTCLDSNKLNLHLYLYNEYFIYIQKVGTKSLII